MTAVHPFIAHAIALTALAVVTALRFRQIDGRASPDCQYYINHAGGQTPPSPYCYRLLTIWLARLVMLAGVQPIHALRAVSTVGSLACVGLVYGAVCQWSGTPLQAGVAAVCLVMADGAFGSWVMFPWLTDGMACALGIAAAVASPVWAAVLLLAAALTKEAVFVMAWAFIVVSDPSAWWTCLAGLGAIGTARLLVRPGPGFAVHAAWLKQPFLYSQIKKSREWFLFSKNLSGAKALPWAAAAVLPAAPLGLAAGAVTLLAFAQTLVAVDHARLIGLAVPWVASVTVLSLPDWALVPMLLLMLFWPTQTEYV